MFLKDIYEPSAMTGRYDYIPADSSAGVILYDDEVCLFSPRNRSCKWENFLTLLTLFASIDLDI